MYTAICKPALCGAYIYYSKKPATKYINEGATVPCAIRNNSSSLSDTKCVICKGQTKFCPCTKTMAIHGPPRLKPSPVIRQTKILNIATEHGGCDAAVGALRASFDNLKQFWSFNNAPNLKDLCNAKYNAQLHDPDVYFKPPAKLPEFGVFIFGQIQQDYNFAGKD